MGFSAGHGSGAGAGGSPEGPSAAEATRPCGATLTQIMARSTSVPKKTDLPGGLRRALTLFPM